MSVENPNNKPTEREKPKTHRRERAIELFGPVIRTAVEKGLIGTTIEGPQDFNQEFMDTMSEKNEHGRRKYNVMIVVRHEAHPDGFIIAALTSDLTMKADSVLPEDEKMKGFFLPLAQSLEDGQQDRLLMKVYHEIKPLLKDKYDLITAPIVRKKDKIDYEMQADDNQERRMRKLIANGFDGIVLFPEGTTTSGKTDKNGNVNGMVHFDKKSIKKSYVFQKRQTKRETLFIPAATFGGRDIMNPDSKWVSPLPIINTLISPYPRISRIKIGSPIRSDSEELREILKGKHFDQLNDFFGERIAALIPPEERGIYA